MRTSPPGQKGKSPTWRCSPAVQRWVVDWIGRHRWSIAQEDREREVWPVTDIWGWPLDCVTSAECKRVDRLAIARANGYLKLQRHKHRFKSDELPPETYKKDAVKNIQEQVIRTEKHLKQIKGALSHYLVFLCRFLRSKMAARRLWAVAPTNELQALAALSSLQIRSFALDRRRSISQFPVQSRSSLARSRALRTDQESENEKTSSPSNGKHEQW